MKILVTGMAGFIGYHTALKLISQGHYVYGIDNINDYYDTQLKYDRLNELGVLQNEAKEELFECKSSKFQNLKFKKLDLINGTELDKLFQKEQFDKVCHLAAQAGVRYSLDNPRAYIDSNIVGFLNVLEGCRHHNVSHLVYASSSSVYGKNKNIPFEEKDRVDNPISLYAATKKSNELMACTYNHLYSFATTGLRFFTVYGPWGRPDMAIYLFVDAIFKDDPIKVFNRGKLERDFTFIDDITEGVFKILNKQKVVGNDIYNIGNGKPVNLLDFIKEIEKNLKKKAKKNFYEMQPGDVFQTWANVKKLEENYSYKSTTKIPEGVSKFIEWYLEYNLYKNIEI